MKLPNWILQKLHRHHKFSYKKGIKKLRAIANSMKEKDEREIAFPCFDDEVDEKLSTKAKIITIMIIVGLLGLTIMLAYWFGIEQGGLLLKDL